MSFGKFPVRTSSLGGVVFIVRNLCDKNAVTHNPVKGITASVEGYQGKTLAIADHQAQGLLEAPKNVSLKDKRDRVILATLNRPGF